MSFKRATTSPLLEITGSDLTNCGLYLTVSGEESTVDAIQIEHRFGDIWGAKGRGHEADADAVRNGEPKYLAKALTKACKVLSERFKGLPESDPLHPWIEDVIETASERAEQLKTEKLQDIKEAMKNGGKILNHALPLWEAYADSLHLVHVYLKSKGL
jgi:hypothetical protein